MVKETEKKTEVVAPHLPKEVRQKGKGEIFWHLPVFKTLLVTVLFGFFSGLVGGMVINSRPFDEWLWGSGGSAGVNRGTTAGESRLLPRDLLAKKIRGSLVTFYRQSSFLGKESLPRPEEAAGYGFFVTADGWIATTADVLGKTSKKASLVGPRPKDWQILTAEGKIFLTEKIVFDPISDLVLVKAVGEGFKTLPFVSNDRLESGLGLWAPISKDGLKPTELILNNYFSPKTRNDYYLSSERTYRFGLLKDDFGRSAVGLPALTTRGEIAGLMAGPNFFIRASLVASALQSVVKSEQISRAYLGVHFVEAEALLGQQLSQGVKLSNDPFRLLPALEKKSPFLPLGLKAGDIILSLGGESITALRSLPDILADYQPGAKLEARYLSNGEEKDVMVEVGEVKQ